MISTLQGFVKMDRCGKVSIFEKPKSWHEDEAMVLWLRSLADRNFKSKIKTKVPPAMGPSVGRSFSKSSKFTVMSGLLTKTEMVEHELHWMETWSLRPSLALGFHDAGPWLEVGQMEENGPQSQQSEGFTLASPLPSGQTFSTWKYI